jgi:hypothetical protein
MSLLPVLGCSETSVTIVIAGSPSNLLFTSLTLSFGSKSAISEMFYWDWAFSVPLTKRRKVALSMGAGMYLKSS